MCKYSWLLLDIICKDLIYENNSTLFAECVVGRRGNQILHHIIPIVDIFKREC